MKKEFFDAMMVEMEKNQDVYLLFGGLGYPRVAEFIKSYPDRAVNTEASEQTALDIAVGLAYGGKIPVFYTITPFLLRGLETIRTYINHENLNVKLVGAGRDDDYSRDDGFSHDASDIYDYFNVPRPIFPNFVFSFPQRSEIRTLVKDMLKSKKPYFISLSR